MKIVSITWAGNEEDILSTFVRHNAQFVDQMIIVLHRTFDRSIEILHSLQREGYTLDIRQENKFAHIQSIVLTSLMHEVVRREHPHWIMPLDPDEFLCSPSRDAFEYTLQEFPSHTVGLIPWCTYIPTPSDPPNESNLLKRITHRQKNEPVQFVKICIPRCFAENPEAVISLGSHVLSNRKTQEQFSSTMIPHIKLAHFPVRSELQLRRKIISGWESHCANPDRKPNQAFQWEILYPRCHDPIHISPQELQDIALWYAVPLEQRNTVNKIVYDPVLDVCSKPVLHSRSSSLAPPGT